MGAALGHFDGGGLAEQAFAEEFGSGGGARSAYWGRLLATLLERPLHKRDGGEAGGALGAARLGWLADGGELATVCAKQPVIASHEPQPARRDALLNRYERFGRLYPLLQESFRR